MTLPQKKLQLIQMLRGIASMLVVLFHMTFNFSEIFHRSSFFNIFDFGSSGVDIFFVLSGFIIAYANIGFVARPTKAATFVKRRFVRIFPIYWIIISLFLVIQLALPHFYGSLYEYSFARFLSTYLLLPGHTMVNGVSWSLTNELFFYLLFTLAIFIPVKKVSGYLLAGYFFLLVVVAIARPDLTTGNDFLGLLFFPMNIEFLLGIFIVLVLDKIPVSWIWPLLLTGIGLFITGAYILDHEINIFNGSGPALKRVFLFGLPSFFIILALVKMELIRTIPVNQIFLHLGDASYSIYLIHLPLVVAFYKVVAKLGINNAWLLVLLNCVLFVAVCVIGIIIYLKIEKPLIKKLNRI